ncbi:hypothetical protein K503DRAFT_863692 [Rhizopogon vinicolor AM-OR11-026]|uniref:GDP/GTP exchange factor Sec2 N-terminal domain-containing protein n=1 Tax=Rhizopogon vinicolor AM-OR11-026 TaxID=1314800 RepID=A0A1B7N9X4_9AGAM|nr:hypothetical protein K503DRAFT_863692 [Rhizopogon vinicolor AM-OR11-026]
MATAEPTHEQDIDAEPVVEEPQNDQDTSDAQAQIIASLRSQVTDLFSQVTQLNGKLVKSYERVSDLEDQLHVSESSLRNASVSISSLELERTHHLAALNTGLLVEKEHVTTELNRLMERATEEAAQRGQAETARHDIEKELDDLSASLFQQANTMVAEARFGQAKSERKVCEAEEALKGAEEAVKIMQTQMQGLQAEKEDAERRAEEARISMGKGKWSDRDAQLVLQPAHTRKMRLVTLHVPYAEFIAFVTHLRGLRILNAAAPAISSLLGQPFLARLLTEDSEPTVRLDLAPSLNWLSRRSVLAAIHTGMLIVEPVPFSSLLQELHPHSPTNAPVSISCALCGMAIVRAQSHDKPPSHPLASLARSRTTGALTNGNSWFKNPLANSPTNHAGHDADREYPEQVYVFRLAPATLTSAVAPASLPLHSSAPSTSTLPFSRPPIHPTVTARTVSTQTQQPYPLCTSNYCLLRLRNTCSLWAFVRAGVVERIWEEEHVVPHKQPASANPNLTENAQESNAKTPSPALSPSETSVGEKPPVLPRRRRLWEMASAFGERAVNWTETSGGKSKDGEAAGKLPPPPPAHPSVPHPHAQAPPPLPKRNEVRGHSIDTHAASSDDADKHAGSEAEKSNSQESFTTPVDSMTFALPSPIKDSVLVDLPSPQMQPQPSVLQSERSVSPHTVPLPETPSSPAFPPASSPPRTRERVASPAPLPSRVSSQILQRPGSPLAQSRSRAGSPAPRTPSRTASPAPHGAPPVPRRAPARRAVPAPPAAAQADVKERITMPSPAVSSKEESVSKAEATDSAKDDKRLSSALEQKGVAGEEGAVEPFETSKPFPDAGLNRDSKRVSMDSPTHAPTESQSITVDPTHSIPEAGRLSEDSSTHEKSIDTSSTKHSSTTDGEGYVGDATWEDRTWKEIVRLKEEMFWARVGGVR